MSGLPDQGSWALPEASMPRKDKNAQEKVVAVEVSTQPKLRTPDFRNCLISHPSLSQIATIN